MFENWHNRRTLFLAITALGTAFVAVATMVIVIPLPGGGYINVGDSIIFVLSPLLGPIGGAFMGGVGSMLADILLGYAVYAPFTLVIKGAEGFAVGLLSLKFANNRLGRRLAVWLASGAIIVVGYFFVEVLLYAVDGTAVLAAIGTAALQSVFNILQIVACTLIATVVYPSIGRFEDMIKSQNQQQGTSNEDF